MSRPLVSVLVPAYNLERYVAETVESVLAQTYPHVETIVVDDGSRDGTLDALRPFEARGVRVIAQHNAGACVARNRALAEARGDYLQYLDADDLISPDKIERQVDLLSRSPTGCLAICGTVYFEDGTDPDEGRFSRGSASVNSDDPVQWLVDLWTPDKGWGMVSLHAWLIPRAVADDAGEWDPAVTQDQDGEYLARVLMASRGVRWEPEGRAYYRKFAHAGSVSRGRSARHLRGRLRAIDSKLHHVLPRTSTANRAHAAAGLARQYRDVAFHAYPAYPDVFREAEWKAARLGGSDEAFHQGTRLRHVARLMGWKAAKRISHSYHAFKGRSDS